jgi:lipopolysaccharide transport system permease protein
MRVTRNELAARYAGSLLGLGWVILAPLLILSIYAVVYLQIFRVQAPGLTAGAYVLYIFSGLVPFLMTAEAVTAGVSSIVGKRTLLNNTAFPIDLVPAKAVLASQPTMFVGIAAILVGLVITRGVPVSAIEIPLIWAFHLMFLMGANWILALFTLVFRDLQNLVGAVLMLMLVASPIAYTPEMVPQALRLLLVLNPFAHFVTAYQGALVQGQFLSPDQLIVLAILSTGSFALGAWFFSAAKRALLEFV